jgi:EAL domain-containing protein (putative c-di-GMP-specific phosphodiesterase class I)
LVGFEALVRWQHPRIGLILPREFIPLAQETGLILSIDRWVLVEACHKIREWQVSYPHDPPLKININITSGSMAQKDLVETIQQTLKQTGLDAHCLNLEITENVAMQNDEIVTNTLAQLKIMGIDIQIDDFGTGYSSLAYLQHIPVGALKIGCSFIQQINTDITHTEIIRTIIDLSHHLGLQAVAEGVETKRQLDSLMAIGCDFGQGSFLSNPLDQDKVTSLLETIYSTGQPENPWFVLVSP